MQMNRISAAAALLATVLLAGCSWDEDIVPVMTGESGEAAAPATMPAVQLPHGGVTPFESSGTAAGDKAAELRGALAALQSDIDAQYAAAVDAHSRATAALGQYNQASLGSDAAQGQAAIGETNAAVSEMSAAASGLSAASTTADDLLRQTREAYNMDDIEEEDRAQLSVLEGEVNRTKAAIDQAVAELNTQVAEQNDALSRLGAEGMRVAATGDMPIAGPVLPAPGLAAGARPFVVIRFEQPDVAYQSQLSSAIGEAMQRRPGATFDVVAVTPNIGSPADIRRNTREVQSSAREVLEYLTSIGVPAERVTLTALSSDSAGANEVQIFVR
jgi:hypothetical protein